jgi:DNA phosphorothioation-associated putative methyltransferase
MENTLAIPRHKTAIHRTELSRPLKCALRDGLLGAGTSLFDYGCGHGHDLDLCHSQGIAAAGWDPVFRPDGPLQPADVVNLGLVLNVIVAR